MAEPRLGDTTVRQDHGWSEAKSPLNASRERAEADIARIID
jgi:hypothetical protein